MNSSTFFPASLQDRGEFLDQRVYKLTKRCITALTGAFICTLIVLVLIQDYGQLNFGYISYAILLFYIPPFLICIRHIKTSRKSRNSKQALSRLTRAITMTSIAWNISGILILPGLEPDTMMMAICIFTVVSLQHSVPFSLFPERSFLILSANFVPLSTCLMIVGHIEIVALGVSGLVFVMFLLCVVSSLYRFDLQRLGKEETEEIVKTEPDNTSPEFFNLQTLRIHRQNALSVMLQITIAYFVCFSLLNSQTEMLLWCWFLAFLSTQTLRLTEIVLYQSDSSRHERQRWRLMFGAGVVAGQLAWAILPFLLQDILSGFHLGILSSIFIVVTVISSHGLAVDRMMLYLNSIICLISTCFIFFSGGGLWALAAFGSLGFFSMFIVLENMHRSAIDSMNGHLMRKLNEYRAVEMESLNMDLTEARESLIQVNASLESQVRERTQELSYQATHDMLTGLGNRFYFSNIVSAALDEVIHDENIGFVVYLLDLDRFKEINDGLGHLAGDRVLTEVAERIRNTCGDDTACARWGGDEFVILQRGVKTDKLIFSFAEQLVADISKPIDLDRASLSVGVSVGVAICPQHGRTVESLLEHIDIAVYRAKCTMSKVTLYNDEWGKEASERLLLTQKLRKDIELKNMDVALQPFISTTTGKVEGFEALARWHDKEGATVCSPGVFIPLAEESGLISQLGFLVLEKACTGLMRFASDSQVRLAVNVSVQQLQSPEFISNVESVLEKTGLAPERLELEITESLFARDVEKIRSRLHTLRGMGVRISIDDFGTGYSSISYLRDFPLDTLKIDQSFVAALSNGGKEIYSSIISLALGLNLSVIVEGVETNEQLEAVLQLGGDEIQGYLFSKPISLSEHSPWFDEYLNRPLNLEKFK